MAYIALITNLKIILNWFWLVWLKNIKMLADLAAPFVFKLLLSPHCLRWSFPCLWLKSEGSTINFQTAATFWQYIKPTDMTRKQIAFNLLSTNLYPILVKVCLNTFAMIIGSYALRLNSQLPSTRIFKEETVRLGNYMAVLAWLIHSWMTTAKYKWQAVANFLGHE